MLYSGTLTIVKQNRPMSLNSCNEENDPLLIRGREGVWKTFPGELITTKDVLWKQWDTPAAKVHQLSPAGKRSDSTVATSVTSVPDQNRGPWAHRLVLEH